MRFTAGDPVAIIKVVDNAGKPVQGAVIRPDGLRPKRINGHWSWPLDGPVKPTPVTTDARGLARVPYPRFVFEQVETGEISFQVEHPDFCSDRPFRVVSTTPPANARLQDRALFFYQWFTRRIATRPAPVVLKPGGVARASGYIGSKENREPEVHAQLASMPFPRQNFWQPSGNGVLVNRRVPEGSNAVRLIYFPAGDRVWFSEFMPFDSRAGQTNEFSLELKPGVRLTGNLDASVPRPITHGQVQVFVSSGLDMTNDERLLWQTSAAIQPDGRFQFESLPRGSAEVIALCDGYKSKDGKRPKVSDFVIPQVVELEKAEVDMVIEMEPTATFELTVLDDKQKPLANADVWFWPNVIARGGSGIFMNPIPNSEELWRAQREFDWQAFFKSHPGLYGGRTDARGIAVISNLPAFKQWFSVGHTNYEMPIEPVNNSREASADLRPGETFRTTVNLRKKGEQFVQSPR